MGRNKNKPMAIAVGIVILLCLTTMSFHPDMTEFDDYHSEDDQLSPISFSGSRSATFLVGSNHSRTESSQQQQQQQQQQQHLTKQALSDYPICRDLIPGEDAYVCRGPEYDQFADKWEQFVLWSHRQENTLRSFFPHIKRKARFQNLLGQFRQTSPLWGQRMESPFPANFTILAVGSSHTRQIFQTIECQYTTLSYEEVEPHADGQRARRGSYYRMEFTNHAKVHLLTNNYIFYSKDWLKNIENRIGLRLDELDAIVIGKMIESHQVMNTSLLQNLIQQSGGTLTEEDFLLQKEGPGLLEFSKVYNGPIVAHSLMAFWGLQQYTTQHWLNVLWHISVHYPQRAESIRVVDGFRYVDFLGSCHTDEWKGAGVCEDSSWKHPCFGNRGGHGDLLAWDIVEALHDLWRRHAKGRNTTGTTT